MGTMRLLTQEPSKKFELLTDAQKGVNFYMQVKELHEDLIFLQMTIDRFKKSNFNFYVTPAHNMSSRFWRTFYHDKFNRTQNRDGIAQMLCDYYIAANFFSAISGEDIQTEHIWCDDTFRCVRSYFKSFYHMDLIDYVDDFISCSHLAGEVRNIYANL